MVTLGCCKFPFWSQKNILIIIMHSILVQNHGQIQENFNLKWDISDDEIIGLKSTAIKFKNSIKKFVTMSYLITTITLIYLFFSSFNFNFSTYFIFLFFFSLVYQIIKFKKNKPASCLHAFKFNNYSGLFLFLGIFLTNI